MPSLLLVVTGADHWTLSDGTRHPTGFWAEELVAPLAVFDDAGVDVTIATPGGVRPTVDAGSLDPGVVGGAERAAELRRALDAAADRLAAPMALEDVTASDYDGVFIPGGHGPMEDLAVSPDMGRLLVALLDDGKVVASVCHGPAALLPATRPDGTWAFADRNLAGFTNEEERQAGLADQAPWLLEDRMREAGGTLSGGAAWEPFSVVDGNVVTGQNPASSADVARRTVERLHASASPGEQDAGAGSAAEREDAEDPEPAGGDAEREPAEDRRPGGAGERESAGSAKDRERDRRHIRVPNSDHEAFAKAVAEAADLEGDAVERAIEATLVTLGERISEGEARDLARHLPDSLTRLIVQRGEAQGFGADEFFRRVAEREGTDAETAERHARAVVAALARREGRKELHDMISQLPHELRERLLAPAEAAAARR